MDGNSALNAAKCKANRWRVRCICFAIKEDANTSMLHTNVIDYIVYYKNHVIYFHDFQLSVLCSSCYQYGVGIVWLNVPLDTLYIISDMIQGVYR